MESATPKAGAGDSLSYFLLIAGYLLLAITGLIALRFAVFDLWLDSHTPGQPAGGGLLPYLLGFLLVPLAMIVTGHLMRRK